MLGLISMVRWVIVGAETNNRGRTVPGRAPEREWVEAIVAECRRNKTPVFVKDNLRPIIGDNPPQEIP